MGLDLTTDYGGLSLETPIMVGSCPLTAEEMLRVAMISSGVGGIVLPSMFEEQVTLWNEQNGYVSVDDTAKNQHDQHVLQRALKMQINTVCETGKSYLDLVRRASSEVSIPVIASLNGECDGNWESFAVALEAAGAAGIELYVRQPPPGKYADPREIEDAIVKTSEVIAHEIGIPLFLKLGRNYTSVSQFSRRLLPHVAGLVLFGQSPHVDIELERMALVTCWALTDPGTISPALESLIRVHGYCPEISLAASGGIDSSEDVIKVLLAGADVAMVTSAIYRSGPAIIGNMLEGLRTFMVTQQIENLDHLRETRAFVFDSDTDRIEYVKAMSVKSESSQYRVAPPAVECDRWGHPHSPR